MRSHATAGQVRVLYLMHVDWRWLRQRPHWLADLLDTSADDLELRVAFLPSWRRSRLTDNPSPVRRSAMPQLPFGRRPVVQRINRRMARIWLARAVRTWRPDVIVVPYPTLGDLLPSDTSARIIYDCMDLAVGFTSDDQERASLAAAEQRLVDRASEVVTSSDHLARHIRDLGAESVTVVRNGTAVVARHELRPRNPETAFGYIGTISQWFDFPTVIAVLDQTPSMVLHLWGSADVAIPDHPRLRHHGPVPHSQISTLMTGCDGLLMPFVVTELIEGVDPVKLYEYIASGRPTIAVDYPELAHFGDLIHRYRGADELRRLVCQVREDPDAMAPDAQSADAFLASSTWAARARAYADVIRRVSAAELKAPSGEDAPQG